MGPGQSKSPAQSGAPQKKCYYEILGLDRQATDEEVKKAYRRKALELHPDRNYGNVEAATLRFAEISSAYEVLSDPQERAWYDSHRDSILRGEDDESPEFEHNVGLTSAADLVSLISRFSTKVPFTDAPNGFYGILRDTFAKIAKEEYAADDNQWRPAEAFDYPDFGYAAGTFEDTVKPFYRVWINFTTKKSFAWRDAYNTADAPDRAFRRVVEKRNKQLREQGIREFNDTVRSLVAFVRKRDPRYIANSQSAAEKEKALRDAAAAQAARSRAANQAKFERRELPDWAKSQGPEEFEGLSGTDSELSEVEEIECIVCDKVFKSEKQFETHEKSKKHIKAVRQLQREMEIQSKLFNLDTPADGSAASTPAKELNNLELDATDIESNPPTQTDVEEDLTGKNEIANSTRSEGTTSENQISQKSSGKTTIDRVSDSSDLDDEMKRPAPRDPAQFSSHAGDARKPKVGKAKAKRARKAAKQGPETVEAQDRSGFKCASCNTLFASKTKLFNHIKDFPSHAQPVAKAGKAKNQR